MKKLIAILVIAVLVFSVAACAPSKNGGGESTPDAGKTSYRVAMVANAPIDDGGWNAACYAGMVDAAKTHGFETMYTENVAEADYVSAFTEYANMGVELIFAPGNEFSNAILEVAPSFPDINFVVLNGDIKDDNISSIKCNNTQHGFLGGIIAGLKTKTNHVGFVGGMEITTALQAVEGYKQGVAYTNPNAEVHVAWANSYSDAALGKEIAVSMVTTYDVDVFFGVASAVDMGVREGAKQFENRYAVAQPDDFLSQAPDMILSSVITDNAMLIGLAMKEVKDGTFGGSVVEGGAADGVVYLGEFGDEAADFKARVIEIYEDLRDGKINLIHD